MLVLDHFLSVWGSGAGALVGQWDLVGWGGDGRTTTRTPTWRLLGDSQLDEQAGTGASASGGLTGLVTRGGRLAQWQTKEFYFRKGLRLVRGVFGQGFYHLQRKGEAARRRGPDLAGG